MGVILEFKKPSEDENQDELNEPVKNSDNRMRRIQDSLRRINDLMQELKSHNDRQNKGDE